MARWHLTSRRINEVVEAEDQWAAWNTLRNRPADDFGMLVQAEANENGDPIPVKTTTLMTRWGRDEDAAAFGALARSQGLPDRTGLDA